MTRNEKKTAIENMAERFMNISDLEGKSMAIMVMSAYAEGKAAGKVEERRRWEQKEAVATTAYENITGGLCQMARKTITLNTSNRKSMSRNSRG